MAGGGFCLRENSDLSGLYRPNRAGSGVWPEGSSPRWESAASPFPIDGRLRRGQTEKICDDQIAFKAVIFRKAFIFAKKCSRIRSEGVFSIRNIAFDRKDFFINRIKSRHELKTVPDDFPPHRQEILSRRSSGEWAPMSLN